MILAPPGNHIRPPFLSFCCLIAASVLWQGCANKDTVKAAARKGEGGVPVSVAKAIEKDVPVDIAVVGNVEAYSTIAVKAQVGGQLTKVYFNEGDYVKSNDPLFTIDPRPLEAQVGQSEANLSRDTAQLAQAEANLARDLAQEKYAHAQAERYAGLWQQGIISKDQYEQVRSSADATSAVVAADKAAIQSARASLVADKASLDNMRVQLEYTQIRSPIDGRTGNLMVKQGNVVNANSMDMMTINQVEPIYVTFSVPESQLTSIKEYMARGKLLVIASPQDDAAAKETGVLTFVDNGVDPTTGTIKLKGTFPNTDHKLWPGEFVRVVLRLTTRPGAIVVPNQAVQTGQDGQYVFVVKPDRTVESRPVVTGARIDQELVVEKGLAADETVVTEGQLRLAPGSRIQVRDGRQGGGGPKGRPKA